MTYSHAFFMYLYEICFLVYCSYIKYTTFPHILFINVHDFPIYFCICLYKMWHMNGWHDCLAAQYSQLEKTRGQECSSMGKLWSCSWHSALMVNLQHESERGREWAVPSFLTYTTGAVNVSFIDEDSIGCEIREGWLLMLFLHTAHAEK